MNELELELTINIDEAQGMRVDYRVRSHAARRYWVYDRGLMVPSKARAWPNCGQGSLLLFAGVVPSPAGTHAVRPCRPFAAALEPGAALEGSLCFPQPIGEFGPFHTWTGAEPHVLLQLQRVELAIDVDVEDPALVASVVDADTGVCALVDHRPGHWPQRIRASASSPVPLQIARRSDDFARVRL